jgi:ubiquinone/menaquinone biosynthesis C-methylase UbiE
MSKILVLGCGKKGFESKDSDTVITVDINPNVGADVIHNLDQFPYPFQDNEFDQIHLDNVLEHLTDIIAVMEELHRISKPNSKITIIVPYFRSIWAHLDPTHKHFFTVDTLSYFDVDHMYHHRYAYSLTAKFKIHKKAFNENIDKSWFRHIMLVWANKWPNFYESNFSHLYPMEDLTYHLETVK